ncbi:MAG: MATE family efflux transporter, partial [Acidimicrobiia bacterium]
MVTSRLRPWQRHPQDREITRLALPALGALVAEPIYLLTDTAVVGHLGTPQLGGVAVAGTLLNTLFWMFNFLAYGTTASVARASGAGQHREGAHHGVQALWLASVLGLAVTAAGLVLAPAAVELMGPSAEVGPYALTYLRISLLGAPAVLVGLAGVGYLRGVQNTATPLKVAVGANVANLVAEVLCIYGLGMGLAASAWTTVAAQAGAAVILASYVTRAAREAGVAARPDLRTQWALVRVGRDLFVRTGALLGALAVASATAARLGTVELAAHQIAFQLWSFLALVLDALAIAAQAMVGRLLGAGDAAGARNASRRMTQLGLAAGFVFAAGVVVLRPVLGPLFSDDPAVVAQTASVLWLVAALQPVAAVVFVLDGVLMGAGDMRFLAGAMVGALVVFLPICALVATADLSLVVLWAGIGVLMA